MGGLAEKTEGLPGRFAGGLEHGRPAEVVGDHVDKDFALDHRRAFAGEMVHAHGRLDGAKVELRVPAAFLQGYDLLRRIELPVAQACQETQLLRTKSVAADFHFYQAQEDAFRKGLQFRKTP